jgi:hypothetical protein
MTDRGKPSKTLTISSIGAAAAVIALLAGLFFKSLSLGRPIELVRSAIPPQLLSVLGSLWGLGILFVIVWAGWMVAAQIQDARERVNHKS